MSSFSLNVNYVSPFYPFIHEISYRIIDNSKEQSLSKVFKIRDKYISTKNVEKLNINDINFLATPQDRDDPVAAWFIPRRKPNIIIEYSRYCDCGVNYSDLVSELDNIENMSF